MWFVHCLTSDFVPRLLPILNGLPLSVIETAIDGIDVHIKIAASKDIADLIWDAGFHVSEV